MLTRKLRVEALESRRLLNADTNLDGNVTAVDALAVINHLQEPAAYVQTLDVNRDNKITALDALNVINHMAKKQDVTVITYRLGDLDTVGLTTQEVMTAISASFWAYEQASNLDLQITSNGRTLIASREIWLGAYPGYSDYTHARGLSEPNRVWFHSGYLGPGHHHPSLGPINEPVYYQMMANTYALQKILMHEIGHTTFGWVHHPSGACVMNINASSSTFCPVEVNALAALH